MKIKTISAKNTDGDSDTYRLLCTMHQMAGQMAVAKIGGWALSRTATFEDYVLTVWTNGIVDLTAETHKCWDGDTHRYQLSKVIKDEE